MSVFLQPIFTQVVGSTAISSIAFNNIPQNYTDLKIVFSVRSNYSSSIDNILTTFNNTTSNYSFTEAYGSGTGTGSGYQSNYSSIQLGYAVGNSTTSNAFSNGEMYIPNYTSLNYKSCIVDCVNTGNLINQYLDLGAGLWSNTSAITSIKMATKFGSIMQYSTFSLYGVLRQGI
jgi:hypothetical protein